uniref:Putative salivary lipocalin n=1 Tax=Rhipicephalus pulchellus TaxID=72859 RepID=L7MA11_RHIPC
MFRFIVATLCLGLAFSKTNPSRNRFLEAMEQNKCYWTHKSTYTYMDKKCFRYEVVDQHKDKKFTLLQRYQVNGNGPEPVLVYKNFSATFRKVGQTSTLTLQDETSTVKYTFGFWNKSEKCFVLTYKVDHGLGGPLGNECDLNILGKLPDHEIPFPSCTAALRKVCPHGTKSKDLKGNCINSDSEDV